MQIMLPHGEHARLADEFKVSRMTIYRALMGRRDTALTRKIRKAAIERGGQEFDPDRKKRAN